MRVFSSPSSSLLLTGLCSLIQLLLLPLHFLVAAQDSVSYDIDSYGADDPSGTPFQTYMSNTNVRPPQMQINRNGTGLQSGYVFLGVNGLPSSGQDWPVILGMFEHSFSSLGCLVQVGMTFSVRTS